MTFQEALNALLVDYPDAQVGLTARPGSKHYAQATGLDFDVDQPGQYVAKGPRGGLLYLGIQLNESNRHYKVISLGPNR